MDETILSRMLNGFREPSPQARAKIASLLQSDEEWLFEAVPRVERSQAAVPPVRKIVEP